MFIKYPINQKKGEPAGVQKIYFHMETFFNGNQTQLFFFDLWDIF